MNARIIFINLKKNSRKKVEKSELKNSCVIQSSYNQEPELIIIYYFIEKIFLEYFFRNIIDTYSFRHDIIINELDNEY